MSKPREVYVNMLIKKNEVTPWVNNPVGYIMYSVCHSPESGPFSKNEVLFREVFPDEITDTVLLEYFFRSQHMFGFQPKTGMTDGGWYYKYRNVYSKTPREALEKTMKDDENDYRE